MDKILKFKGSWRAYQKRILDALSIHLNDNKIHVVAAPGAGKTILGIEIISRLNKPTLILAPTLTIKNQWKERILDCFCDREDLISTDIFNPKFITVTTYQALLAAFCNREINEEDIIEDDEEAIGRFNYQKADKIINILKKAQIEILCFDEAHHLTKEWWKALNYLVQNLEPKQTVSLTATPPYDAILNEWNRYEELCGEIDEIISIPELVQNGDLCPHQDFIYFSFLRKNEGKMLKENLANISDFCNHLLTNNELIEYIEKHINEENEECFLDNPEFYISALSYLKAANKVLPDKLLKLFDLSYIQIPKFNNYHKKIFLNELVIKRKIDLPFMETIKKEAKSCGIILNKTLYLNDSPKIKRQIANSASKIDSIKDIVKIESASLKNDLRMVILADYIKEDVSDFSQLGVIPIFLSLKNTPNLSVAVLTGSIVLVHKNLKEKILSHIQDINFSPYEEDENYLKISTSDNKSQTVNLITDLFNEGFIHILIGTQALLGEGWDAPCINSLVLSSTVSSYMLSNQMRGRAIRRDKNNPDKVANIWHLASIKILNTMELTQDMLSGANSESEEMFQLSDYEQLETRFKGFEAPGFQYPYCIENDIKRILGKDFHKKITYRNDLKEADFSSVNKDMIMRAKNREQTKKEWKEGLQTPYTGVQMSLKSGLETNVKYKTLYYKSGYYRLLIVYGLVALLICANIMALSPRLLPIVPFIGIIIFAFLAAKPTLKFLRCSTPEKILRQICIVMLETLSYIGVIKTSLVNVGIEAKENEDKSIFVNFLNLDAKENNILVKAVLEFLDPIKNPRYLFVRKNKISFKNTVDYHAVPDIIGQNKNYVLYMVKLWKKYIGDCGFIYTRTYEGRRALLKARKNSYSSLFEKPLNKRLSRYQ